jgi:hypothetical protein
MKTDPYLIDPCQEVELHGLKFPLEYLFRGMLVVGQPGAGKTRGVLIPLLRSILQATGVDPQCKAGLVIADPKGEFEELIRPLLREMGREEDLINLRPGEAFYNVLASPFLTPSEAVEKIIGLADQTNRNMTSATRGEDPFWSNALRSLLGAIVSATRTLHGQLTFPLLNATFRKIDQFSDVGAATQWMRESQLDASAVQAIRDYLRLPADKTRPCVASSLTNTLQCWQQDPLQQLTTPSPSLKEIDPIDVVHEGKILLLSCTNAAFGVSLSPLLAAVKEHLFSTVLSRKEIETSDDGVHWVVINQERPIFFFADEFQQFVTTSASTGELASLDRLRSFKCGYIAATQNISSLISVLGNIHHANRLISLLSNQAYLSNICPATAAVAENILGRKKINQHQPGLLGPPSLFRKTTSARTRRLSTRTDEHPTIPRVDASVLARMKTGEFWLRLADGTIHHKRAKLISNVSS